MKKVVVVCGCSGVGKGTLIKNFVNRFSRSHALVVSHTSRKKRKGENDGADYHFISETQFEEMVAANEFLEWEQNHGNYYGTSYAALTKCEAKVSILEIDIKGAINLKRTMEGLDLTFVWVNEENLELLADRIRERGSITEENIRVRLETAKNEIKLLKEHQTKNPPLFDVIVENSDDFEKVQMRFNEALSLKKTTEN